MSKNQFDELKVFGSKEKERRDSFPLWLARPALESGFNYKVIKYLQAILVYQMSEF